MNNPWGVTSFFIAMLGMLTLSACTTTVYKEDVKKFSDGVDNTTEAFERLREKDHQKTLTNSEKQVVDLCKCGMCPQFTLSKSCSNLVVSASEGNHKDNIESKIQCFTKWAEYTAGGRKGAPPSSCKEPVGFYNLPKEQAEDCTLEVSNPQQQPLCSTSELNDIGTFSTEDLNKEKGSKNLAMMVQQLSAYADALEEIVSAKDVEELTSSVAGAKNAFAGLATTVSKETGRPVPAALGPISDLLGSALIWVLETKRYNAMKSITGEGDPIVRESAEILSRNSLPLAWKAVIKPAFDNLENSISNMLAAKGFDHSNAAARLEDLRAAREAYRNAFANDVSATYAAMADAHAALEKALKDPDRQIETMQKAIGEFHKKSVAVREALSK